MLPVILYRRCNDNTSDSREIRAAEEAGFFISYNRNSPVFSKEEILPIVVSRYSCLPFYRELEQDLIVHKKRLINNIRQHNYVADLKNYVADLKELTPETWDRLENIPDDGTSFVLKGATNSKKFFWNELMFAKDKATAIEVHGKLQRDGLIGEQEIYIRRYVPLKTYDISLKGLPITHEFRFFIAYGKILSGAFYWSSHLDLFDKVPDASEVPQTFLNEVIKRIGNKVNAYCLDVALTQDGQWIVIELNDLQMAGLSENDPKVFYSNLYKAIMV